MSARSSCLNFLVGFLLINDFHALGMAAIMPWTGSIYSLQHGYFIIISLGFMILPSMSIKSYISLTRALLGLWISHRLLGGGGAFERPPWSRLLVAVEKNERQRSKAREKSFRNHFGHFLAQVKFRVSRGQNSKIFQNGFSTINLYFKDRATNLIPSCLSR